MAKTNFKSKVCENFALELLEFIKTIFFVALSYHFWDSHLRTFRLAHTKISIYFKMKTFFFFFYTIIFKNTHITDFRSYFNKLFIYHSHNHFFLKPISLSHTPTEKVN